MAKEYQLPFKVGQSAEARSFENGFRGAWFRCKIQKISCKRGHWNALLEYFDYPDEKLTWTKLYQYPPYNVGKSREKRQLMLRPQYPSVKLKNEVSDVRSISEATVVADGNWQAGDMVDWWANDCYWSGKLTKLFGTGEAELALTPPPVGEGAIYKVSFKDLRPSLDWSPNFGWTVPTSQDGDSVRRCAQLIQPVNQALGCFPILEIHSMNEGRRNSQATAGSSSTLPTSDEKKNNIPSVVPQVVSGEDGVYATSNEKRKFKTKELAEPSIMDPPIQVANTSKKVRWSDISSGLHMGDELAKGSILADKGSNGSCIRVDPDRSDKVRWSDISSGSYTGDELAKKSRLSVKGSIGSCIRVDPDRSKKVRWSDLSSGSHLGDELAKKSSLPDKGSNGSCIRVDPDRSKKVRWSDISSGSHTGDELAKKSSLSDKGSDGSCIRVDAEKIAGPTGNFNYSNCPLKKFRTSDGVPLHSMGSDSTEAAILDLEELANKIKWLKGLLEFGGHVTSAAKPSWKFVEHHKSSG